jgi:GT2 family glycosyltransferase
MPLPAIQLLQPDCPVKPAWALFDPVWYLKCYGDFLPAGVALNPLGLLAHYLQSGGHAGHSPNPLFDEMYYRAAHPEIGALVEAGHFASGFDHFCRLGHRFLSGHWLFDEALYAGQYDDMALENLDGKKFHGRYDHYLRSGQHEHRLAHPLFDGKFYAARAIAAGDDPRMIERTGPYAHFLYRLRMGAPELPPSIYFDPVWYGERHGQAGSAIEHYLRGTECFDPVPEFSEAYYREIHPDVRAALEARDFASGYRHFLQIGVFELRRPHPEIDLVFYRDANASVRGDLNTGAVRDTFAHLRAIGIGTGLPCAPPPGAAGGEAAAKELFVAKARDGLAVFALRRIDFTPSGVCRLAVILVMFEKFELTMNALSSLRGNDAGGLQLILVDNGSTDATREIGHYVRGAKIIRLDRNIGYLRACNLALEHVTAEFVLFLNNDVELGFGAVESAIARLTAGADIGAVGGKVIRSHGLLQEAGCIIWRDGSTAGYMRDASPLAGEANFVRDVDFCSGAFLLCRAALVKDLGGLDVQFSPAYYEEADLCLRMAEAGFRVVYDPAVVIHHLEYGSADSQAAQALMRRGRRKFAAKHATFLKTRLPESPRSLQAARAPPRGQKRILFIEDIVPLRGLGSGYVRAIRSILSSKGPLILVW